MGPAMEQEATWRAAEAQAEARARIGAQLLARLGPDDIAATCRTLAALVDMRHEEAADPSH